MGLQPADEVILPAYTHPSTANAFAAAAAELVFVDVEDKQLVMDVAQVERAISTRTRVIVAVHYGGFSADMLRLRALAAAHNCLLVEDAAHALLARQGDRLLGTFGTFSCFSFEHQKNISSGEGGVLLIGAPAYLDAAACAYEAGTNRAAYLRGEVDAYAWRSLGAKYAISELVAAYLWAGLEQSSTQLQLRRGLWNTYHADLQALALPSEVALPQPTDPGHNAHLYYLLLASQAQRTALRKYLDQVGVETHTHYVPLHTSPYGRRYRFCGEDTYTTACSERILRLPLHAGLTREDVHYVVRMIDAFFKL